MAADDNVDVVVGTVHGMQQRAAIVGVIGKHPNAQLRESMGQQEHHLGCELQFGRADVWRQGSGIGFGLTPGKLLVDDFPVGQPGAAPGGDTLALPIGGALIV